MNKNIILDTDIGPDCDDTGALALLHILKNQHPVQYLAMTSCTSNPYACGTIDAINQWYGHHNVPIGMFEQDGFLADGVAQIYNKPITEQYPNDYVPPFSRLSALEVLKEALRKAQDKSVTFITIGPLNNMASLVNDAEGFLLVKEKAKELVAMATGFSAVEWNVEMDISAAQTVINKWPSPIVLSPFETGEPIITGKDFGKMHPDHPVRLAYKLHNHGDETKGRMSWDLTAVWYAVAGAAPFFGLSNPVSLHIDDTGLALFSDDENGTVRLLLNHMLPDQIGQEIDRMWW